MERGLADLVLYGNGTSWRTDFMIDVPKGASGVLQGVAFAFRRQVLLSRCGAHSPSAWRGMMGEMPCFHMLASPVFLPFAGLRLVERLEGAVDIVVVLDGTCLTSGVHAPNGVADINAAEG